MRIAHNLCVDHFRKIKRSPSIKTSDDRDIFEVINFEDFNDFIDSLDRIYADLNVLESKQIDEFKKNLFDQEYNLYKRGSRS